MKLWPYFLGAWLIISGLSTIINLSFQYQTLITGVLALVAGIFVILKKQSFNLNSSLASSILTLSDYQFNPATSYGYFKYVTVLENTETRTYR